MDSTSVDLPTFLAELRNTTSQEEVARSLLRAVQRQVHEATGDDRGSELLPCVLYLRGAQGYRAILTDTPPTTKDTPDRHDRLPSHTAWRWMLDHGEAVFINVTRREVGPAYEDSASATREDNATRDIQTVSKETRELLARHQATHLYGSPLRRGPSDPEGMLVVAWRCPPSSGRPLRAWRRAGAVVQLLLDVAAPFVLSRPPAPASSEQGLEGLPALGASMRPVLRTLQTFAADDANILLTGPTGVGKTSLARWAHERSDRYKGPYRELHLQRYRPDQLLAYLFGWEKGAFTDAKASYPGEVGQADGGTLLLDEVGELSPDAQSQLLQFMLTRRYRRLGQRGEDHVADVRIIAATNRDLRLAVDAGAFREDLFFRLTERPVQILPMSERRDELAGWARFLARRPRSPELPQRAVELDDEAIATLVVQSWPGNLHDLNNVVGMARDLATAERRQGGALITVAHVQQALALRPGTTVEQPCSALRVAARAWLDELERRCPLGLGEGGGDPPPLGWSDARGIFRSYLLQEAVARYGVKEAFERLGAGARVTGRSYNREEDKAEEHTRAFEGRLRRR